MTGPGEDSNEKLARGTRGSSKVCAVQGSKQAQASCNVNFSIPNNVEQFLLSINPKRGARDVT